MHSFFMPMLPPETTHQMKKVRVVKGKPQFYEPTELIAARSKLEAHLSAHIPENKYTDGVRLLVKWCFPINGKHQDGEYKTTKPDLDNAMKLLLDCMTKTGYWKDDNLIASMVVEKFWSKTPGIYVVIESI